MGTLLPPWIVVPVISQLTTVWCSSNLTLGLLAVGSQSSLSVYTLILENDLLKWSKKWATRCVPLANSVMGLIRLTRQSQCRYTLSCQTRSNANIYCYYNFCIFHSRSISLLSM